MGPNVYARSTAANEPIGIGLKEGGRRDGMDLPSLRYLPLEALAAAAVALEYGAGKYGQRNWEKGLPWQQMIDSARRHLDAIERRRDFDTGDSELPETCLFMASAMMLVTSMLRGIGFDDRAESNQGWSPKAVAYWMQEMSDGARRDRESRMPQGPV